MEITTNPGSSTQVTKRNLLANINLEMDWYGDNLLIALFSYFESHKNCPDLEPDDNGWNPWAVEKAQAALDAIVAEVESSPLFRVDR